MMTDDVFRARLEKNCAPWPTLAACVSTDPASQDVALAYQPGGLMTGLTNPRGATSNFSYDPLGRLLSDQDAIGAEVHLTRTRTDSSRTVMFTSGEGRQTQNRVVDSSDGSERRTVTDPANLLTSTRNGTDDQTVTRTPDGTITTATLDADPRFGMAAPVLGEFRIETPAHLARPPTRIAAFSSATPRIRPAPPPSAPP